MSVKQHIEPIRGERVVPPLENTPKCQINVGKKGKPKTCGETLVKINAWTWECRRHGEVH